MGPKLAYVVKHRRHLMWALSTLSIACSAAVRLLDAPPEQLKLFECMGEIDEQ